MSSAKWFDKQLLKVNSALLAINRFFIGATYSVRAIKLVWSTHRGMTLLIACLTVISGLLPALMAYFGKLIVDNVSMALISSSDEHLRMALIFVALEGLAIALLHLSDHSLLACRQILQSLMTFRINEMILGKVQDLELAHFEDTRFYDRLIQAREGAANKPLGMVEQTFGLVRDGVALISIAGLIFQFSPWAVLILAIASLPAFLVETSFANKAFELFKWQSPEKRMQEYLVTVLTREDYVKEVKLLGLSGLFFQRYKDIFNVVFAKEKRLATRRELWSFLFGLFGTVALYATFGWVVYEAALGSITLGDMTMYLMLFKKGQESFFAAMEALGGMYENNLYLTNLYEFLEEDIPPPCGSYTAGPLPEDGLRFNNVWFTYPGSEVPALKGVSFHVKPGEKLAVVGENGSGKTTLVKLLTRLYEPESGTITWEGLDLREWNPVALRRRIGVIFQDFIRYQLSVGENIGVGDLEALSDESRWQEAAEKGMAAPMIEAMPEAYKTPLGRWFKNGRELSGGQWQKVALSRAFMRRDADILILDEPTAAIDAPTEIQIFDRFRQLTHNQMAILISHRFSTVRLADTIMVMENGTIIEMGKHETLLSRDGLYAQLFQLQAAGYQ